MHTSLRTAATMLGGLLAVIVFGLVAYACGNGGSGGGIDSEAQELLEQIVLGEADLPSGLARVSATFSTNEDVAGALSDSDTELKKLESWGRRLGYDLEFAPGPEASSDLEIQGVQHTVSLYRSPEGAADSFSEGVALARETDWPALYPGVLDLEVEEIDRPGLGEEAVWFRIGGFDSNGRLLLDDQVAFRVGPVRSFLRVVTVSEATTKRDVFLDQIEAWVQLVADGIEAAVDESGVSARAIL